MIERKFSPGLEFSENADDDDSEPGGDVLMTLSGYAATYEDPENPDAYGDIIDEAAFDEWLASRDGSEPLAMRDGHGKDVGAWTRITNDKTGINGKKGLWVEGEVYAAYTGPSMATMIRKKVIRGLSVGFTIDEYSFIKTHFDKYGYPVRRILKSTLKETSPTSSPANDNATIEAWKSEMVARDEEKSTEGASLAEAIKSLDLLLKSV